MSDTVSLVPHSAGLSWESWLYLIRISTPPVITISDYSIVKVYYSHLNWQNVFGSEKNSFVDISCLSLQLGWNDSQILCILLKLILNVLMDQLNLGNETQCVTTSGFFSSFTTDVWCCSGHDIECFWTWLSYWWWSHCFKNGRRAILFQENMPCLNLYWK